MRARPACFWLEGGRLTHESQWAWRLRRAWDGHCVLSPSWGTSIRLLWGSGTRAQSSPCAWPQKPGVLSQGQGGDPGLAAPLSGPAGLQAEPGPGLRGYRPCPSPGSGRHLRPPTRSHDGVAWPSAGQCAWRLLCVRGACLVCPGQLHSPTPVPRPRGSAGRAFWKVLGW